MQFALGMGFALSGGLLLVAIITDAAGLAALFTLVAVSCVVGALAEDA